MALLKVNVACMGRVVKTKVDGMIGSKLTSNNVLVTDAWRADKTYANEKGIEHYRIKSDEYLAWFLFVDSYSNESTKHNIKEFLLTSFVFEMTKPIEVYVIEIQRVMLI